MSHHYRYRVEGSGAHGSCSTYAEASEAVAAVAENNDALWEIIRTDDRTNAWIDVLSGSGSPDSVARLTLRHYPPNG